ncbi:MAG: response regulator [Flavobacteriaceae bacterium]|nr:response regulator [Flavobacteriaceae bacterium]
MLNILSKLSLKPYIVAKLIALFFTTSFFAQTIIPPINNFYVQDYKGGNQNWGIDSGDGYIYVANNEGLLEFDGVNWHLYKLPHGTIIRSVKVVGDKIYTGSYEEFGYWERLANGDLSYTSLSSSLDPKELDTQAIWEIYNLKDAVIFKSFAALFIYENGGIKVIKPGYILMASNVIDDRFYVQGVGNGLLELENNKLVLLQDTEQLAETRVQAIIPLHDKMLIGTAHDGCYEYANKKLSRWQGSFNELLKENQLNTLSYTHGFLFAGTIKNGVYRYDPKAKNYINLNVKNGLQNNTVLASYSNDSMLWLALDNGISAIPINFYAYYLNPYKEDIGAVYDVLEYKDAVYVATNTGIYKIHNNAISFIEGSQDHTWSLTLVNDQIICGHNSGTYEIINDKLYLLDKKNGGYVFKPLQDRSNTYIQGNYSGLTLYKKILNKWEVSTIVGINFPVKNIIFEKPHVAWVLHANKGIFRIFFTDDYKKVFKIEPQYNKEFHNIYRLKLFSIDKNIAFYDQYQWYAYNSLEDRIEPFESLNRILGRDRNAVLMNKFSDEMLIFKKPDNSIFIRKNLKDSVSQFLVPKKYYDNKLVRGEGDQKAVVANDSVVYIALYNDVLAVNTKRINVSPVNIPKIDRIYTNAILQDLASKITVRRRDTLNIEVYVPFQSNNSIEYSLDDRHWSQTDGKITLINLSHGLNELLLRSYLTVDKRSEINKLEIYVKPPWYLGIWGLVLALTVVLIIFYLITVVNKYVLIKHKNYLEDQYRHQQEIHRKEEALINEKKINELLKKQHEIELNSKTKELANTAMEMTKKDELLDTIKGELQLFKKEIINKPKFDKLLQTINKNINTSKDWEVFESNFNEIHDSFFKSLIKKHEHLTPKDLKLCAYLKMNLSTKEIAPLLGISHRGVEIHRYRLRKKLDLDTEQNLNEYLMKIS